MTTTKIEDRILRRMVGERAPYVQVVPGRALRVTGAHGHYTTPSGRTIVRHPSAYGWRTIYHCSDRTIDVGATTLRELRSVIADKQIVWGAALPREFAIRDARGIVVRYTYDTAAQRWQRAGVAMRLPSGDLRGRFGAWEHARTIADCRREIRAKRAILAREAAEREVSRQLAAQTARDQRRARLLARLSSTLTADYQDARAEGYCDAGITAWCVQRGIALDAHVPLATLARDADRRAQAVALRVARRYLAQQAQQQIAA